MEHWEFLLQKEGDRSWLPLDSPDVEILEGRYRIVARSNHTNAAINIRIAHLATEAVPPKRRLQKRSCRTNHDGLMVVIPFTQLEPGLWELCCSPTDLMSDLIAGAQPYAVKLQVVACELEEDWDPDWSTPTHTSTETDFTGMAALSAAGDRVQQPGQPEKQSESGSSQGTVAAPNPIAGTPSVPLLGAELQADAVTLDRQVALPPEVGEILGASMERLFQIAEQMSEQLVDEVLQEFDLSAIADAPADANETVDRTTTDANTTVSPYEASTHTADAVTASVSSGCTLTAGEAFALTLDQTAFVAARHDVVTLSGQVTVVAATSTPPTSAPSPTSVAPATTLVEKDLADPWDNTAFTHTGASAQELQLYLRDPQSLQVLVSDRQPLAQQTFPCPFTFSFSLPDAFATHLVLGEVLLCGTLPGNTEAAIALTTQAFSITVDPNALVGELTKLHEALTADIEDEERIDLPLELSSRLKEQAAPPLDLSFLNWAVVEPQTERSPRFPSLAGQPLPPQLYQPDPETRAKTLNLPAFKLTTETTPAAPATNSEATKLEPTHLEATLQQTAPEAIAIDAIATGETGIQTDSSIEIVQIPADESAAKTLQPKAATDDNGVDTSETVSVSLEATNTHGSDQPLLDLPSPTHMAFQSLKLQDRFLTRLASLATDTELSALLKASLAPGNPLIEVPSAPSQAEARSLTEEIVVDDEPLSTERRRTKPAPATEPITLDESPNPLILPADDAVPTPALEITTGELTAGKPINLRVKLPDLLPRIYVKLWVIDRQTRSLLDGPRWLVDFLPNGLGALEAMTPMTVPFGSVELRFEAIAVEMHTQRESHKVTVDRFVVPPDLPIVSLDDFNA